MTSSVLKEAGNVHLHMQSYMSVLVTGFWCHVGHRFILGQNRSEYEFDLPVLDTIQWVEIGLQGVAHQLYMRQKSQNTNVRCIDVKRVDTGSQASAHNKSYTRDRKLRQLPSAVMRPSGLKCIDRVQHKQNYRWASELKSLIFTGMTPSRLKHCNRVLHNTQDSKLGLLISTGMTLRGRKQASIVLCVQNKDRWEGEHGPPVSARMTP